MFPKIKYYDLFGYFALVAYWVFIFAHYGGLPDQIPIHYNGAGEVDGYGPKASIFALPSIGTMTFFLLQWLSQTPGYLNFPVEITEVNKKQQYENARIMLLILRYIILVVFILIDYKTIQVIEGEAEGLGNLFVVLICLLLFFPVLYFCYRSLQLRGKR